MVVPLTCRLGAKEDLPALRELWEKETDWGPMDPEFRHWLHDNPWPGSFVVVAVDADHRIVGQFSFIAMPVSVQGDAVQAARTYGAIVSRTLRESWCNRDVAHHPVKQMFGYGVSEARARGYRMIFSMPDPRWSGFFRLHPTFRYSTFTLWSRSLPLSEPLQLPPGYWSAPLTRWDDEIDRLWQTSARLHGCVVMRDARTLQWKLAGFDVRAVYREARLVGLVSSRVRGGDQQNQLEICDVLSEDIGPSLDATLRAVVNVAHHAAIEREPDMPLKKAAVLMIPVLEQPLCALGFGPEQYEFPFFVHCVDPMLSKERVDPSRWYLSQND